MHDLVQKLHQLTQNFVGKLEAVDFKEAHQFIALRDQLMNEIQRTEFTKEEVEQNRVAVMDILSHDAVILTKLQQVKDAAGDKMAKLSAAKQRKQAYDGYAAYSGAYYDKRK